MQIKILLSCIAILSWLAFVPATKAQFLCDIKEPASVGDTENDFNCISCNGNNCTAALNVFVSSIAYPNPNTTIGFMRSNDGGRTWAFQNPGLPGEVLQGGFIRVVQQIDSLNVVAVGDTGLIVRTTDGGA